MEKKLLNFGVEDVDFEDGVKEEKIEKEEEEEMEKGSV